MEEVFFLNDNRRVNLFIENDNFLLNNLNVSRYYSVFRLEPNTIYTESCKNPNSELALFETEQDALNFGISYLESRYGQLNKNPV